jgi:hypothetical protein
MIKGTLQQRFRNKMNAITKDKERLTKNFYVRLPMLTQFLF